MEEETKPVEPYGTSPYDEFRAQAEKVEDLAGMHWTNNVWQIPPTTAEDAEECWDEAVVAARRVEYAAAEFAEAVAERRAALRRQLAEEAHAAREGAGS